MPRHVHPRSNPHRNLQHPRWSRRRQRRIPRRSPDRKRPRSEIQPYPSLRLDPQTHQRRSLHHPNTPHLLTRTGHGLPSHVRHGRLARRAHRLLPTRLGRQPSRSRNARPRIHAWDRRLSRSHGLSFNHGKHHQTRRTCPRRRGYSSTRSATRCARVVYPADYRWEDGCCGQDSWCDARHGGCC